MRLRFFCSFIDFDRNVAKNAVSFHKNWQWNKANQEALGARKTNHFISSGNEYITLIKRGSILEKLKLIVGK